MLIVKDVWLISSAEEWESGDNEGMDNDDLLNINAISDVENDHEVLSNNDMIILSNNKQKPCPSLKSYIIFKYISYTSTQFDRIKRIEVIAKELFQVFFQQIFHVRS
ncbi:unnamed protein product [Rhizophagus irregularis]|uniref:Uncharacterized protein n=1 Tax=Rhizophagus irregularis TaxID=588596 RepID=A0A915ZJ80_9GLOM|nr:unnamed protein product [Rhizophagus irregularis]